MRLGRTNLDVSRIGFGGLPIQRLRTSDAVSVVRHAFDLGITFYDTARAYLTSEERIGKALRKVRGRVVLATKTLARTKNAAAADLEQSLQALRTEYIDLWQLHCISTEEEYRESVAPEGALEVAHEALHKGVIGHIGLTSHSLDLAERALADRLFETVQIPVNVLSPEAADRLLPLAEANDVGLIAMKPFAGGVVTDARLAIGYLLQFPAVLPIPGIERKAEIEELQSIARDGVHFSAKDLERIGSLRSDLGTRFCRRCGYCLPCPNGVPIPVVLNLENMRERVAVSHFRKRGGEAVRLASACRGCKQCVKKCPFDLPIDEMLRDAGEYYRRSLLEGSKKEKS